MNPSFAHGHLLFLTTRKCKHFAKIDNSTLDFWQTNVTTSSGLRNVRNYITLHEEKKTQEKNLLLNYNIYKKKCLGHLKPDAFRALNVKAVLGVSNKRTQCHRNAINRFWDNELPTCIV